MEEEDEIQLGYDDKGYIKLPDICKIGDKKYSDWIRQTTSQDFINQLSHKLNIPVDKLTYEISGRNHDPGIRGHSQIAIQVARWAIKDIEILDQVEKKIAEIVKLTSETAEDEDSSSDEEEDSEEEEENEEKSIVSANLNELFKFQDKDIRVIGTIENPWFIGKNIAELLGYEDAADAIKKHVESNHKQPFSKHSLFRQNAGIQIHHKSLLIDEAGLYSLIFSSKLPKAKEFKEYVFSEILPSIRKKGYFIKSNINQNQIEELQNMIIELENKAQLLLKEKEDQNEEKLKIHQDFVKNQQGQLDMLISIFNSKVCPNMNEFMGKNTFYMAIVGIFLDSVTGLMQIWIKFGISARSIEREKEHLSRDFENYELFYISECDNSNLLENAFKAKLKKLNIYRKSSKNQFKTIQKEMFILTPEYNVETMILIANELISKFNKTNDKDIEIMELKHQIEILKKNHEIEMNSKEKEIMMKDHEIEMLKKNQSISTLKAKNKTQSKKSNPTNPPFKP